ncbi:MAG TPA: hypothetical protein VK530_15760 [Candidatus Acidoferrum sp.]|nr:hypothetical protein [Candidatus Acidoferrum sp.]
MDDAFLMRVLDGLADLNEKLQPFLGGQRMLVAVIGNLDTANKFHDEIRTPRVSRSGIENLRDVGVIHHRQRLPLRLKTGDDTFGVHARFDDLQSDAATNRFFLFRHEDNPAASFADLLQQLVVADAVAGLFPRYSGSPFAD